MKIIGQIPLLVYVIASSYGAVWVSDEFDDIRIMFYSVFIPLSLCYFSSFFLFPKWQQSFPMGYSRMRGVLVVAFFWGNFLLVNALLLSKEAVINHAFKGDIQNVDKGMLTTAKRGGLGWIYKTRW